MTRPFLSALLACVALAGCNKHPNELAFYDHPSDAQVQHFALIQCLNATKSAQQIGENGDYAEAVRICHAAADSASRYCTPALWPRCQIQFRRTRGDVRLILSQSTTLSQTK